MTAPSDPAIAPARSSARRDGQHSAPPPGGPFRRGPRRRPFLRAAGIAACFALLLAAAWTSPALAEERVLRLDPEETGVTFLLESTFHDVHGTFKLVSGEIRYDSESAEASGRIEISAASGESGNKSRDKKMHEEVLESAKYPSIVFLPTRVTGDGTDGDGGHVTLEGTIELHGLRKEIAIPAEVAIQDGQLTGTASLTIPYVEWGMKDPSVFIFRAAKQVEITLHLSGTVSPE